MSRFRPAMERFEEREVPAAFTFELPGASGYGDFTDPSGVDPTQAVQSIPVSDLLVSFQGAPLTRADASGPVAAHYEFGVFVGVTASFDLAALGGQYAALTLDGAWATGTDAVSGATTVAVSAAVPRPYVMIDTRPLVEPNRGVVATQLAVTIRLDDDTVNTIFVTIGANDTAADIATKIRNAIEAQDYKVVVNGTLVTIWGRGDAKVEDVHITITAGVNGRDFPYATPRVTGENGATGSASVNIARTVQSNN